MVLSVRDSVIMINTLSRTGPNIFEVFMTFFFFKIDALNLEGVIPVNFLITISSLTAVLSPWIMFRFNRIFYYCRRFQINVIPLSPEWNSISWNIITNLFVVTARIIRCNFSKCICNTQETDVMIHFADVKNHFYWCNDPFCICNTSFSQCNRLTGVLKVSVFFVKLWDFSMKLIIRRVKEQKTAMGVWNSY